MDESSEVGASIAAAEAVFERSKRDLERIRRLAEHQVVSRQQLDQVKADVDAYKGRTFTGHVESIQGATGARFALLLPDNVTGNFTKVVQRVPVRVTLDPRSERAGVAAGHVGGGRDRHPGQATRDQGSKAAHAGGAIG